MPTTNCADIVPAGWALTIQILVSRRKTKTQSKFVFRTENDDWVAAHSLQAHNEKLFRALTGESNGVTGTLEQAISELGLPRVKTVRPVPSFRGQLTLGNPEVYDSAMCIDVERYPRTKIATAPTASQFVTRSDNANGETSVQSSVTLPADGGLADGSSAAGGGSNLTSVKSSRTYQVDDDQAPGGKRDVDRDDLAKGYEYGRTAVHISESDQNVTRLETQVGLELVGFVPREKVTQPQVIWVAREANGI